MSALAAAGTGAAAGSSFGPIGTVVGAGIGALGSMVGGLFSSQGSRYAARKQLQAVRETNAMNYQIAQENNAFNERMWNEQNAYNTPAAQRARLEEAGLNPYLMLDGSSTGTAQSTPTADTSGVQQAPDIGSTIASGYTAMGNSISSAASQIAGMVYNNSLQQANVRKANADASSSELDAGYKAIQNQFAAAQFIADLRLKMLQGDISKKDFDFLCDSYEDRLQSAHFDWQLKGQQASYYEQLAGLTEVQRKIEDINLKWLPQEKRASLAAVLQNTLTAASQMHLNYASARNMVAMATLNFYQANGVRIDNDLKRDIYDLSVGLIENQYGKGYAESEQYRRGFNLGLPMYGVALGSAPIASKNRSPKRSAPKRLRR